MLEFYEKDDHSGVVSIYDHHITINKTLLKYCNEAYRIRLAVDQEEQKVYIYMINKDYALSGELKESSLLKISLSKTYARICSQSVIRYLCRTFGFSIDKNKYRRYHAWYDEAHKAMIVDMKGVLK